MADQAKEKASQAQEQARSMMGQLRERSPTSQQLLGFILIVTGIVVVLVLGGVTLAGTGLALALATPLFIFFSPILVPIAAIVALAATGFVSASAAFVTVCSGVAWLYNYFKGRHPVGADKIDAVKHRIADTASHMGDKAREMGEVLHTKTREVAPGA